MATDAKIREREGEALQLLMDGYSPASIASDLPIKHKVTPRTARRYVAAEQLEYFDAPMQRGDELEFSVALQIERLDRIADSSRVLGRGSSTRLLQAEAATGLREARLKWLQRKD